MLNALAPLPSPAFALPALVASADDRAQLRFLEFFAVTIRNAHTRRAYARAAGEFLAWCDARGVASIVDVQPLHVAAWIEQLARQVSVPTVKQRLAGVRHLFDWLVTGQVVPVNPAASVRGPAHSVRRGKTPVLAPDEARRLLDAIDVTTPAGLRDRALMGSSQNLVAGVRLGQKPEKTGIIDSLSLIRSFAEREVERAGFQGMNAPKPVT